MPKKLTLLILLIAMLSLSGAAAQAEVVINAANFPDDTFRAYVMSASVDVDGDGVLSGDELLIVSMEIIESGVESLTGIEYFTGLEELYCYSNNLTALDVSKNVNLYTLECDNNKLTKLDLSKNINLMELECELNALVTLDLASNENLYYMKCYNQSRSGLEVVSVNNQFRVDISPYVGRANLARVVSNDITGRNASDDVISSVSYNVRTGIAYFDEFPYSVTYKYSTGFYDDYGVESTMDVTLVTSGDFEVSPQPAADEETPTPVKKKSRGGGGGCDMTGSMASAALVLIFAQSIAKHKRRS
ncbi:MAG: hypothetical protein IJ520_07320 [Synergistaceae bacterium]|nr:hypothetical protein [Synergistaceae bacterium]